MSSAPNQPRLAKAGLVRLDPDTGEPVAILQLQFNPDTLTRSLKPKGSAEEGGGRVEAVRLTGPAVETISLEAELDVTDALAAPDDHTVEVQTGLGARLAALEALVHPTVEALKSADEMAAQGFLELLPAPQPITLFVWGRQRVVPVRITDFSITEEAFDIALNPTRARVSLSLRVLSTDDLGHAGRAGSLFLSHLEASEARARRFAQGSLNDLGIGDVL
ncbi:MAG: hypothetical protein IPK26_05880 [Planctomycetes bacterium]|nr:hypothetical protein [Planctomycetota bacterium]